MSHTSAFAEKFGSLIAKAIVLERFSKVMQNALPKRNNMVVNATDINVVGNRAFVTLEMSYDLDKEIAGEAEEDQLPDTDNPTDACMGLP